MRYIDADKLIAHLKDEIKECEIPFGSRANGRSVAYGTKLGLQSAISFAETLATADVAPKSEVAEEIIENVRALLRGWCNSCYPLDVVFEQLVEMKKKYTEEKE